MSTSQTTVNDENEEQNNTPLLRGLKNDEKQDTRSCRHENCHGNLSIVEKGENEIVICQTCRCTPDGVYLPPESRNQRDTPSSPFNPKGSEWDNHLQFRNSGQREQYKNSRNVKMVGGFENAWSPEKTSREDSLI